MGKCKRIEAELELPEEIIQYIQRFLNGKEAAQSTLLSKSWYAAWLTRPNLDFDQDHFRSGTMFGKYMKKTVERYETLNLKIDSLRIWIYNYRDSLVKVLIMKALKMGATGLAFSIDYPDREITLPREVFESENLVKLSVSGCKIGTGEDGKVSCSRLKSLRLTNVYVESDTIIWDIISSCPLIENLSLSAYHVRTLSSFAEFGKRNVGSVVDSLFNKLKSLFLTGIKDVDTLFFHDFSSKFPCLKNLSLHVCGGYKEIEVSSPSLECISFMQDKILTAKFDVPSIRKFKYWGPIPSLSFKTTSTNWRSHVSITIPHPPKAKWILKMNQLLIKLSQSKVSLSLLMYFGEKFDCPEDIKVLCKPQVENLMIDWRHSNYSNSPELLDALFWCCRPIYVTQEWFECRPLNCDFMEIVYSRVMQHVCLKGSSPSQSMCDLEEVDVEFFDEAVSAWRPRLLDDSTCPGADKQRIRLHLKWRS